MASVEENRVLASDSLQLKNAVCSEDSQKVNVYLCAFHWDSGEIFICFAELGSLQWVKRLLVSSRTNSTCDRMASLSLRIILDFSQPQFLNTDTRWQL